MISKILSISSGKPQKPSGKVKGIVVSNSKGELVVKLPDSTINLSVVDNDLKTGDAVSLSFSKDTVNLKKIVQDTGPAKDLIKIESSNVIRNILSQIDYVKSLDNVNLQKTLESLSNSIKNRELQTSLLEKSISVLKEESESIKLQTGNRNREIDKLINLLTSLKESLPESRKSEFVIKDANIKIDAEGTFDKQFTIKETIDDVKTFFNKKGIPLDLLKSVSLKSGPYMISVTPGGDLKEALVDIYPEKAQLEGVKNLQKMFFESSQLKNVSPEILVNLLKDTETIKPDLLVKLDALFESIEQKETPAPVKDGVMKLLLPQLVSIVEANEIGSEHLNAKLAPLADENLSLQLLDISKDLEIQKLDPQFKKLFEEISTVGESKVRKDIIPILFKLTGLSNESEIIKLIETNSEKPDDIKNRSDVKNLIAEILHIIDSMKNSETTEKSSDIQSVTKTSEQPAANTGAEIAKYLNEEIIRYAEAKLQIEQHIEKLENFQSSQPKSLPPDLLNNIELIKPELQVDINNILKSVETEDEKLAIKDALVKIFIQQRKSAIPESNVREKVTPEQIVDSLKPIVKENEKLSALIKHLLRILQKVDNYSLITKASVAVAQSTMKNGSSDLISKILSQMLALKDTPAFENSNIQKVLISLAKNIKSEQISILLIDNSVKILEKENAIVKATTGVESKDISKLASALSSLKETLQVVTKGEIPIHRSSIKSDINVEFKPIFTIKDNLHDVKSFLNRFELPQDLLKRIPAKSGPYMISITPEVSNEKVAISIYPEKELVTGITDLQKTFFKSSQFKSASPEGILDLLKNIGTVKPESMADLDTVFKSAETSNSKLSMRDEIIKMLFPQFTTGELKEDTVREKLLPMINEKLYQQLLNVTQGLDIKKLNPQIEKILSELSSVITDENRKSIVPALFKLAEMSTESEMFSLSDRIIMNSDVFDEKDNLKGMLLKMLKLIDKADGRGAVEGKERLLQNQETDPNRSLNDEQTKLLDVKKQVTQIIEKIEAFQVLAKSVPTTEGKSQLIVLPVNMGGEWVDMQLRITHKKQKPSQKNDKKRISVALNIELSAIGEVSAEMEYFKNREIAINVTLSNKRSVEWFEKNRTEIEEGLRKLDLNVIKLNFRSSKSFIKTKKIAPEKNDSSFDIVG